LIKTIPLTAEPSLEVYHPLVYTSVAGGQAAGAVMAKKKPSREEASFQYPGHLLKPDDLVSFIEAVTFRKNWDRCGLTDTDLFALQVAIMARPKGAPAIQGTGGLRKLRFSPPGSSSGKSGSHRVCYVYFEEVGIVLLVLAYAKARTDTVSPAGRNALRKMIEEQRKLLVRGPVQ
jgi:hypothetical protein